LLLGLILLSALTLLGVASGSNSVLQGQMAQNLENHIHSRQAAAFAIRWGEAWLLSRPGSERPPGCETGCDSDDVIRSTGSIPYPLEQSTQSWWDSAAHEAGTDPQTGVSLSPGVGPDVTPPRWFIEEIHHQAVTVDDSVLDIGFYRIVAHGSGPYDHRCTWKRTLRPAHHDLRGDRGTTLGHRCHRRPLSTRCNPVTILCRFLS
jgi:Tfp pilus assembly protein PilX